MADETITAASYLLVDRDSFEIIAGKDYHKRRAPASTTKVMTSIIALESLSGEEMVVPDRGVSKIPASKLGLIPGKRYRALDLIKGSMIESANDAAYAIGTYIAGSENAFARMMTQKAHAIGANDTQFKNASGLYEDGHYTTCYDLALIFSYALNNERFREIANTKYFLFDSLDRKTKYKNHNRLLFCFEASLGGKTGFTRLSRHCYVGAFEKDERVYILSMLGSNDLWGDAIKILTKIYNKLPSNHEIKMARANSVTLTSYKKIKKRSAVKRSTVKKKVTLTSYKKTEKRHTVQKKGIKGKNKRYSKKVKTATRVR
jgi:D-alanyl-D-alanine carboxypeptidase (penicillin-binding protein 5/6)